jgi:hypothetical protein
MSRSTEQIFIAELTGELVGKILKGINDGTVLIMLCNWCVSSTSSDTDSDTPLQALRKYELERRIHTKDKKDKKKKEKKKRKEKKKEKSRRKSRSR